MRCNPLTNHGLDHDGSNQVGRATRRTRSTDVCREIEAASDSSSHSGYDSQADHFPPERQDDKTRKKQREEKVGPCEECAKNRHRKQVNFDLGGNADAPHPPRLSQQQYLHRPPIFGQNQAVPHFTTPVFAAQGAVHAAPPIHPAAFLPQGPIPHPYTPARPLLNLGCGPSPLFGWESVTPLPHVYGQPGYTRRFKPDYRRFCFSVGKADVPHAALPGGPLWGYPTTMAPQLVGRW